MIKSNFHLVAATLFFLAWAPHAGAGRPGGTPPPVIESVEVNPVQHRFTLTGRFFGGATPVLTLGKHQLEVSEATPTQVVAKLPLQLRPATGPVFAYNAGFERNRIRDLAQLFDDLAPALEAVAARIVDLFQLARASYSLVTP